jgi:hypothetical protein
MLARLVYSDADPKIHRTRRRSSSGQSRVMSAMTKNPSAVVDCVTLVDLPGMNGRDPEVRLAFSRLRDLFLARVKED